MRKFHRSTQVSAAFAAVSVLSFIGAATANTTRVQTELHTVILEKIYSGLDTPWALAMLPEGDLLVTERDGNLILLEQGSPVKKRIVRSVPKVSASGQGGLLDVILDRDFKTNSTIYFTFSHAEGRREIGTALASAQLKSDANPRLDNVKILYTMPEKDSSGRHFGSRIVQAEDGTLFFTIGDRGSQPRAQNPFDPAGSVLRINTDGSIPSGNPYSNGKQALPEIWSIGHRNPQGATLHPETGRLWTISHGARGGDEINIPEAGKNYGWPRISYGRNYSGTKIGIGQAADGLEQPIYHWDPSIAPSGADFYENGPLSGWNGNLFVGALRGEALVRLEVSGRKITYEERLFEGELGRIRDVRYMPDGALWIVTNDGDGSIYKITTE